ncbi:MAG: hypothetical protein FJZ47_12860 [Candidatus Tectomicrobia bacterium]|uniref:Uncharacterized protein n=1 Tax=Tectimicrobiota bacterium TaxID=2528274 RepID=A0A937W3F5_UNCTE|nr:hypothetical protein [Candidatus Tectomicrobia bacterium]
MRTFAPTSSSFGHDHSIRSRDGFSRSRLTAVQAETRTSADITLVTAEGDKVTLSAETASQASYLRYDARGRIQGQHARVRTEVLQLNASEALSVQIEGNLNDAERADIQEALSTLADIATDFFDGDTDSALSSALDLTELETLQSIDATLEVSQSVSVQRESTRRRLAADDVPGRPFGGTPPALPSAAAPHASNLLQTLFQTLQQHRVETPTQTVPPVSSDPNAPQPTSAPVPPPQ